MVRGMRTYIRGIRDQLNSLSCVQVVEGSLDETADTEVFVKLHHKKTVFTWTLNLKNMPQNLLKMQFYYYSSITKQRKSTAAVPEEGVYVHHSGTAYL
jgi:cytochrome oxidase Cu insertion factor (SCO1/SenC/PrrC family)